MPPLSWMNKIIQCLPTVPCRSAGEPSCNLADAGCSPSLVCLSLPHDFSVEWGDLCRQDKSSTAAGVQRKTARLSDRAVSYKGLLGVGFLFMCFFLGLGWGFVCLFQYSGIISFILPLLITPFQVLTYQGCMYELTYANLGLNYFL